MEKQMYALVYTYEGYYNSAPYSVVIAISNDIGVLRVEMEKCINSDIEIDEVEIFYINVETFNTYDETRQTERIVVNRFIVTLDYTLIFEDKNGNEYDWTEVTIYNLANILDKLNTIFN